MDLDRLEALAAAAGLSIEQYLQAAAAAHYFKHLDDEHLKRLRWHMLTLLAVVTGGPSKYQGRDLHEAHADLHITGEAFDRVLWHVQATLQELEVEQADQRAILAAMQARRDEVVTFEES